MLIIYIVERVTKDLPRCQPRKSGAGGGGVSFSGRSSDLGEKSRIDSAVLLGKLARAEEEEEEDDDVQIGRAHV